MGKRMGSIALRPIELQKKRKSIGSSQPPARSVETQDGWLDTSAAADHP